MINEQCLYDNVFEWKMSRMDKLYLVNTLRTDMIDGFLPGAEMRYRKLPVFHQR